MPLRVIRPALSGRGLGVYTLQAGEAFTVRAATWTHRVVLDAQWQDNTWPWVGYRAQDGRLIAGLEAPSFKQLGTFAIAFSGVQPWPGSTVDRFGVPTGDPMIGALPDLLLGPGCTIECGAVGQFGAPRAGDVVSGLALTVSDAVDDELAVT